MRRALLGLGLVVGVVFAWAAPAAAHAELQSSEPAASASSPAPPGQVVLRFTEPVEAARDAVRVFATGGRLVDTGPAAHLPGEASQVVLPLPDLAAGGYVVSWRVISGDSHPVRGTFTFRVGQPGADAETDALAQDLLSSGGGSTDVGRLFALDRFAVFASLVVLVGGSVFVLFIWRDGARGDRAEVLLRGSWIVALTSTAVGIALQGVSSQALPLRDAVRPSIVAEVLDTRFGRLSLIRLGLLLLLVPAGRLLRTRLSNDSSRVPPARLVLPAGLVLAGTLLTLSLAGHSGVGDLVVVAAAADLVHLGSVSVWLGGLTLLAVCVLPRGDRDELTLVVPRFSKVALVAVLAIVATGSFQSWRQVGTLGSVTSTSYGRLLLVKLGLFAGMIGLGALGRSWARRRQEAGAHAPTVALGAATAEPPRATVARLRRSVGFEVVLASAVLVVSALLVSSVPARAAAAKPFSTQLKAKDLVLDLTLDPAQVGPTDLRVGMVTTQGSPPEPSEVIAELSLADRDLGPLQVPLHRMGPGRYMTHGFELPIAGRWRLEIVVLRGTTDQVRAVTTVPVR